ncbi:MAG: hypothetical protein Q8O88_01595 [bacterium]|nr:hypothetical protein [bacterium]
MTTANKKIKGEIRISLGKDVQTEHFPIVIAEGLDVLMKPDGYKRVPRAQTNQEEFTWENNKRERLIVNYYTQTNSIAFSAIFSSDLTQNEEGVTKHLKTLYNKLDTTIGSLSQYLGSPYISSTRELRLEIEGISPEQKAQSILPIIRELYKKTEGVQLFNEDILEKTDLSIQILFSFLE